jgi:hypothetical protein
VKEPVAVAEAELNATAMNAAANHQSLGATISRPARLLGANGSNFIEPALHGAVRSDNGTTVPLRISEWRLRSSPENRERREKFLAARELKEDRSPEVLTAD